jgi:hypothetical protein
MAAKTSVRPSATVPVARPARGRATPLPAPHPRFRFELTRPPPRYIHSTESLLAALREFIASGPARTGIPDFDAWPGRPCTAVAIAKRFGGWPAALARIGVHDARRRSYTPEQLIARLESVWAYHGHPPGPSALRRLGRISPNPYRDHWGSLRSACAQLAKCHQGRITRAELLRGTPPSLRNKGVSPALRYRVFERDNFRCVLCGANPKEDPTVRLEADHRHPHAKGGRATLENLQTTCRPCNRGKRDRSLPEGGGARASRAEGATAPRSSLPASP